MRHGPSEFGQEAAATTSGGGLGFTLADDLFGMDMWSSSGFTQDAFLGDTGYSDVIDFALGDTLHPDVIDFTLGDTIYPDIRDSALLDPIYDDVRGVTISILNPFDGAFEIAGFGGGSDAFSTTTSASQQLSSKTVQATRDNMHSINLETRRSLSDLETLALIL